MKTNHNTPTRSKSVRHNGHAGNDTNRPTKYRITFRYEQVGDRFIEAGSPQEARELARQIPLLEQGFWKDVPQTYKVEEILPFGDDEIPKDALFVPARPQS
jgi:hypothetical protein